MEVTFFIFDRDFEQTKIKKHNFFKIIVSYFFFEIDNIQIRIPDLDPDPNPNWARILDPDLNAMYLDPQH